MINLHFFFIIHFTLLYFRIYSFYFILFPDHYTDHSINRGLIIEKKGITMTNKRTNKFFFLLLMMRRWISIFIKTTSNKNSEKKLDAKKKKLQNPNPAKVMRCNSGRLGAYSRIHQQQQQQQRLNGIIHFILNFYFPIRFLFAPIIKLNRICNRKKQKKKINYVDVCEPW